MNQIVIKIGKHGHPPVIQAQHEKRVQLRRKGALDRGISIKEGAYNV